MGSLFFVSGSPFFNNPEFGDGTPIPPASELRITEDGETRIIEDGDERITE